jgi:prenyltransferase beta subunit
MKKSLLLLFILPALLLSSCSKKWEEPETEPETTEVKLKGTWKESSSKREYYDETGAKIHETDAPLSTITLDGASTYEAKYYSEIVKGTYSVTKDNSGEYITFLTGSDYNQFKIHFTNNSNLKLTLETINDVYFVDSIQKTAAKSVFTSTLVKQ